MVALIDYNVSVGGDPVIDPALMDKTLDHCYVEVAVGFSFPTADQADLLLVNAQEHRELSHPLVKKWAAVDKHQGAPRTLRHKIGTQDGLPNARGRYEYTEVMLEERLG